MPFRKTKKVELVFTFYYFILSVILVFLVEFIRTEGNAGFSNFQSRKGKYSQLLK